MEEKRIRVEVNSDVNEFSISECNTIEEVKTKIKGIYKIEDVQLFYRESLLSDSSVYEKLLADMGTIDIKAILTNTEAQLDAQLQDACAVESVSGEDVLVPERESEKFLEEILTNKNIMEEEKELSQSIEKSIEENTAKNEIEECSTKEEQRENREVCIEEKVTLGENNEKNSPEEVVDVSALLKASFEESKKLSDNTYVEAEHESKESGDISVESVEKNRIEECDKELVSVKIAGSSKEMLVDKKLLVTVNGKLYYLKKKENTINHILVAIIPKLSAIITYGFLGMIFTFYLNKIFLVLLLSILVLYGLEKIKLRVHFRRNDRIRNIVKQVICFFSSFWLNLGHNMSVHQEESG